MSLEISRRGLLGAMLAAIGVTSRTREGLTAAKKSDARRQLRIEESSKLEIAILESHWQALQPIVDDHARSAGIEISATHLQYEDLYSQLSLALTQRAPTYDVVFLDDPWIPQFASFLTPLDEPSDFLEAFMPVTSAVSRYPDDAQLCAVPVLGESQFFVARPDWLERGDLAPPDTWDNTIAATAAISSALGPDADLAAFGIRSLTGHEVVESFLPILRGYGKEVIDPLTNVPQLDTPEALAAMDTFVSLIRYSPAESAEAGSPSNAERFAAGQICMMSNFWSSELLAARALGAVPETGPLASTLQPAQPGVDRQSMTGIWLAGIPVGSAFQDSARAFLDWLSSSQLQAELPAIALPPVRVDVLEEKSLIERFPDLPVLQAMLATASPRPRSPFYPQLDQMLASALVSVVSEETAGADAMQDANVALREFLVREGVLPA